MKPVPPEVNEIIDELSKHLDGLANHTHAAIEARDWQKVYATSRYAEGMAAAQSIIMRMYRIGLYAREAAQAQPDGGMIDCPYCDNGLDALQCGFCHGSGRVSQRKAIDAEEDGGEKLDPITRDWDTPAEDKAWEDLGKEEAGDE